MAYEPNPNRLIASLHEIRWTYLDVPHLVVDHFKTTIVSLGVSIGWLDYYSRQKHTARKFDYDFVSFVTLKGRHGALGFFLVSTLADILGPLLNFFGLSLLR